MDPINYNIDVQTPFQAALQGYQGGAAIRNDQQQQVLIGQQQAAQRQMQGALATVAQNPNATGDDYSRLITAYPSLAEPLTKAWAAKSSAQQQSHINDLSQWGAAIQQGQPQIAADAMRARADAMDNTAGAPTQASISLRHQADVIDAHPDFALPQIKMMLASQGDQGLKVVDQLRLLKRDPAVDRQTTATADSAEAKATVDKATIPADIKAADLKNQEIESRIQDLTKRFGLDVDKFRSETGMKTLELQDKLGQLSPEVATGVNTAATESVAASQSAAKMTDLAARLEAANPGSGVHARWGQALSNTFGAQDDINRIRAEYSRIVTPAAMAAYKTVASGSTSDKDIETAMTGVPPESANVSTLTSFLRGAAKLQVYDSVLSNAKSEWLQSVKSLGKAKADINVDGVTVPAGTTFKQFTDQYVAKKVAAQVNANDVATRSYMKYATPDAAPAPAAAPLFGGT